MWKINKDVINFHLKITCDQETWKLNIFERVTTHSILWTKNPENVYIPI